MLIILFKFLLRRKLWLTPFKVVTRKTQRRHLAPFDYWYISTNHMKWQRRHKQSRVTDAMHIRHYARAWMSCLNWISFSFSYQPIPRYRITHRQPVFSGPEEVKIWMPHTYKRCTLSDHLMSGNSQVSCQKANTQWTMFVLWDSCCAIWPTVVSFFWCSNVDFSSFASALIFSRYQVVDSMGSRGQGG